MLGKLIKYEIRGSFRELLPLYAAIIGLSALIRPMYLQNLSESWVGVTVTVYMALLVALFVISFLTIVQRFNKTMLGPEGYLMHTLPVSAAKHIVSKLTVAFLIMVLSVVVSFLSFLIIAADSWFFRELAEVMGYIPYWFVQFFRQYSFLVALEVIYALVMSTVQGILLIYLALCIGHLFPRFRSFISVLAYILGSSILGRITTLITDLFGGSSVWSTSYGSAGSVYYSFFDLSLLPGIVAVTVTAAALFFGVRYLLEHRLKLD